MKPMIIKNALVYNDESKLRKMDVEVKDGIIFEIKEEISSNNPDINIIDANGLVLLPGMIDLHNDEIERAISPKRKCFFCDNTALDNLIKGYFSSGITTVCVALAFSSEPGIRNMSNTITILNQINTYKTMKSICDNLKINLRVELSSDWEMLPTIIKNNNINLITFCDHTPKNKLNWSEQKFYRYLLNRTEVNLNGFAEWCNVLYKKRTKNSSNFGSFIKEIQKLGCVTGIHDMSSEDEYVFGVDFAEFPINMEVINYMKGKGKKVIMGAPNIRNGKSINDNISASDVCKVHKCDILCSDYDKSSLLQSILLLTLRNNNAFFENYKMVSEYPAKFLGVKKGKLEKGYDADMILVDFVEGSYCIKKTFLRGKKVYESDF